MLYLGATNDIQQRISEHKTGKYAKSFTKKYNCNIPVYFEEFDVVKEAFEGERQLKAEKRKRKEKFFNLNNPDWLDLSLEWL